MKSSYYPRPKKNYRPRAAAIEKKIRTAATRICLENGVEEHSDIKAAIIWAAANVKKMQVAGVKASIKKGFKVG